MKRTPALAARFADECNVSFAPASTAPSSSPHLTQPVSGSVVTHRLSGDPPRSLSAPVATTRRSGLGRPRSARCRRAPRERRRRHRARGRPATELVGGDRGDDPLSPDPRSCDLNHLTSSREVARCWASRRSRRRWAGRPVRGSNSGPATEKGGTRWKTESCTSASRISSPRNENRGEPHRLTHHTRAGTASREVREALDSLGTCCGNGELAESSTRT